MKKLIGLFLAFFGLFTVVSCKKEEKPQEEKQYFDVPATDIDHYFSDKVRFSDTGTTVNKNAEGKLEGNFITDKVAKLKLKKVTDGDTAVFHLNGSEKDTYTVAGKSYPYVTIRFLGIDTNESTSSIQPWGKAASKYGSQLLMNAEGIIVDATDLPDFDAEKGYIDRLDSNATRWLALVWYCPDGGNPEDLTQYRSYQLDMIEECYTYATSISSKRYLYNANKTKEPILYERYNVVKNSFGEEEKRFGSMTINEVFFEADNRMSRTGKKIRIQGEVDPNFDYNKAPTSLSITEAYERMETLIEKGTFVELTGVITRFVGNNFYMQDKNGKALYVYMGIDGASIEDMFNVGDTIRIRGRLCEYGGQYQMSGVEFKEETFTKVTDPNEKVPMPEPIVMTGNETEEDIKALMGKLVKTTIYCGNKGSQSKDGSFSLQNNKVIPGMESLSSLIDYSNYYPSINHLEVRINGTINPPYDYASFAEGKTYEVIGIMGIYLEPDIQLPKSYPSYQIVIGNRNQNGTVVNEVKEV